MELTRLLEALADPGAYPYPVDGVAVRQTHVSAVFLAGPYVYKIKKPVDLGFLNFGTLPKRFHFCTEEVRLNRRLAPRVYLGVVPVAWKGSGLQFESPGEVVEWAVKMQRLPEANTILERLRRNEVGPNLIKALARRIASFHREAETNDRIAAFGRFDAVAGLIRDVFARMERGPQINRTVSRAVLDRTKELTEQTLSRLRPLIEERAARGVPRDCHGDLHLDHVYYFPEREPPDDLVVIDCIEFNECFRFIDPVADLAFLGMDLTFHGRRDLSRILTDAYFHNTGDEKGRALLPLYLAYRAMVRGMVEGLLLEEKEVPEVGRAATVQSARAHWLLALTELELQGR